MTQHYIEDDAIALIPYTEEDASDFCACWQDDATQRGYNFILPENGQVDIFGEISAFPFWAVAVDKCTGNRLGVLRLSPDEEHPDLAIWMYPAHRGKGWGGRAYRLALRYLFAHGYDAIYAGCFPHNTPSLRILKKSGFIRWPEGDVKETSVFDGSEIIMLGFQCQR
ncbi:MAG: GNAT family N-acetyltransferase [Clostridia bacterium]|nr:GNAT family N-acetyltransferase [Clostridia bacterium]